MKSILYILLVSTLLSVIVACSPKSENWTHLRGSTFDGHAQTNVAPLHWSETENVIWKSEVKGVGWSSPVIYGNQIWVTSATRDGKEMFAMCYDFKDGNLLKEFTLFKPENPGRIHGTNSYASSTPCIEKGFFYAHYGTNGTACINTKTMEIVWERNDLKCDHMQGAASSPILYKNMLILHIEGTDVQYIIALNKKTGETIWKTERPEEIHNDVQSTFHKAYVTPIVINIDGKDLLISNGAQACIAYDVNTGEEVWRFIYGEDSTVVMPIFYDGIIYINSGWVLSEGTPYFSRMYAVDPSLEGDITESGLIWWTEEDVPQLSTPVIVDSKIYMVEERGMASCLDAKTGNVFWKEEFEGNYNASPIFAAGNIYFNNVKGKTTIVKPGEELNIVAENQIEGSVKATPAFVSGKMILRSDSHLYMVE
ncbi:MAG: PQQ-like beta-propeller repeat protein [Mariniphaga sp.]|nr:PQQ-like beta-propeller repeat protein [Mariniphaga sp.]